jgi:molybdenum cofactor cytidylyltransferase
MIQPIVLAAGLGTRMGAIKPLLPIGPDPALAAVLKTVREAALPEALVVLGHDASEILDHVPLCSHQLVINPRPEAGLSHSLRLALQRIERGVRGVLVFHADMPYLSASTVRAVVNATLAGASLAAPVYGDQRGFPVYFAAHHLEKLMRSLTGDRGGQTYLALQSDALVLVPVDDPGCVRDIDRPEDLLSSQGGLSCSIGE